MMRSSSLFRLSAIALAVCAGGLCFSDKAGADPGDDDEANLEITYADEWEPDIEVDTWSDDSGGGDSSGGGGCGECNPGDRRCWDNWSDQICGTDGNGCGAWYFNSACEDPYICNYAQCGD